MAVEGKLEITIKISEPPEAVEVTNGHKMFVLKCDAYEVSVTLRPKHFNKMVKDMEQFPLWVAAVRGCLGERTEHGFVLDNPSVQVFERKPKEAKPSEESA